MNRITIERKTVTQTPSGGRTESWEAFAVFNAEVWQVKAKESLVNGKLTEGRTLRFKVPYTAGITNKDRILFEGLYFNIVDVNDPHMLHRFLLIDGVFQ